MTSKAVFLDKDGTLVEDLPYNVNPALMRPVDGAAEGLRLLAGTGYELFVVTNQSGVARGLFSEGALRAVEGWLEQFFAAAGVRLAGFYYCPHHPQGVVSRYAVDCLCRKPRPGMLYQAAQEHGLDLAASWMIGDILNDVEAGNRAGCRTILIQNNHETEWNLTPWRRPDYMLRGFLSAARLIFGVETPFRWSFTDDSEKQRSARYD
jgi:D,D-heptose 1,7-bisphosphate phosphatase